MIPTLTTTEEADLVLDGIFKCDYDGELAVIAKLCDDFGISWCPENEIEIESLVVEHQEVISQMYQDYLIETNV